MTVKEFPQVPLHRAPSAAGPHVAHPQSTWTSFDRYDRYTAIAGLVRSALGPGAHRVLDVGDTAGYLALFEPDLRVTGLDVELAPDRLEGARPLVGDGTALPFPDDTFDAVVSSDVLEHVRPDRRAAFLTELRRVSRELVVVAAPFDTPGVAGVEDIVRRYAGLALGGPQPQLEEHHAFGLPDLEATRVGLAAGTDRVAVLGNGNLWDWLVSMLLRFQLEARPALDPLSQGYDSFHNLAIADGAGLPPFYRHLVVSWNDRAPTLEPSDAVAAPADLVALAAVLVAADSSEATRQDIHGLIGHDVLPPIGRVDAGITALHERFDGFQRVMDMIVELPGAVAGVSSEVGRLQAELADLRIQQADTRDRLEQLFESQMQVNVPIIRAKQRALGLRRRFRRHPD